MASYNKFEVGTEDLAEGVHDFDADDIAIYLTNATPSASGDAVKADLLEITIENGYLGFSNAQCQISAATSRSGGVTSVTGVDRTITASGGTVGPFQWVALANDTPAAPLDPLWCWWAYASQITLQDGEDFTVDFGTEVFTIT